MKEKKSIEGICALCGKFKKLSFEHIPPEAAFNDKPIYLQSYQHLADTSSYVYGKKMRSHRGLGGYTLCEGCNNKTGAWYARDFVDFAHQGMEIVMKMEPQYLIKGNYKIKPLNVIKQILTMFMSVDKSGHLRAQKDLVEFLLNKDFVKIPERYKVFLYSTLSQNKRMVGFSGVYHPKLGFQKWAEITFQPFGYLLSEDSKPAHEHMLDITIFGNATYDEEVTYQISTVYLNIENAWIGNYT